MKLSEDFVPSTVDEAVETLFNSLEKEDIDYMKKNDSGSIHFTFGMALRNNWSLWKQGTPIQNDFKKRFKLFGHGDDMSGLILDALWAKVRGEDVKKSMEESAASYKKHWKKYRVNLLTGKSLSKKK